MVICCGRDVRAPGLWLLRYVQVKSRYERSSVLEIFLCRKQLRCLQGIFFWKRERLVRKYNIFSLRAKDSFQRLRMTHALLCTVEFLIIRNTQVKAVYTPSTKLCIVSFYLRHWRQHQMLFIFSKLKSTSFCNIFLIYNKLE